MTASITHCWKKLRRILDGAVRACLLVACLLQVSHAVAGVEVEQIRADRQDSGLFLHVHLKLDIGPAVEDALARGVAIYFVAEAELMRDRWYWYDRKVSQVSRYYRLTYQPLTRQWRLQVSSEPLYSGSAATTIVQTFDSLQAALDVIRRQSGWKLAEAGDLEPDARQHVLYRFRLDLSQLPRPFQIMAGNQSDWNLGLSRQLRLAPESGN